MAVSLLVMTACGGADLVSPNGEMKLVYNQEVGFEVYYNNSKVFDIKNVGLVLNDTNTDFTLESWSTVTKIVNDYDMVSGKRAKCYNEANERTFTFVDSLNRSIDVVFRAYNDGIAFKYIVNANNEPVNITAENSCFDMGNSIRSWRQRYNTAYEDFYVKSENIPADKAKGEWGFPTLFQFDETNFALLSEAGIGRENCGSRLNNWQNEDEFQVSMMGSITSNSIWHSAWRVAMVGTLADIVESTLITDVSEPCKVADTDWIEPGLVSWIYWAYNHGSCDYQIVKKYIDFAVDMNLPYVLIDWEWDIMGNGGDLNDAIAYAKERGVKPLLWFNSSTAWLGPGPLFALNERDNRRAEFAKLQKMGVKGVKVDFFNHDSLSTMNYHIDILEDAADYELMVNFHGATVPRGWQRTYPNMVSIEGVYGAEWYNNLPILTDSAAWHNATLPFTRNVIGPMDYTPCTFTDSQHKHLTTDAHELALLILFESTLQHLADRPEGYMAQTEEIQNLISSLPTVWDNTKLLDGYPSDYVVMARKKGDVWYISGINGKSDSEMKYELDLSFIDDEIASITMVTDTEQGKLNLKHSKLVESSYQINILPRGGFVCIVETI